MDDSVLLPRFLRIPHRPYSTMTAIASMALLLITLISPGSTLAQHCDIEAGSPSCQLNPDIGSVDQRSAPGHHVGNPIDVISGNKYQLESDYQALGSSLSFKRHYNTALVEHNNRLGHGWRHSYHVVLSKVNNNQYQIVQSDGRRILFSRSTVGNENPVFKSLQISDGELIQSELFLWRLPDGRQFTFHGSYLVRIDFNGQTDNYLKLHYKQRRLRSITDQYNRTLTLEYTEGSIGLDRYDVDGYQAMPGHLEKVILPSGETIEYGYDGTKNLAKVQYPDNDGHTYEYSNTALPHHLTQRSQQDTYDPEKIHTKSWSYDPYGRANQYRSNNAKTNIDIVYRDEKSSAEKGIADIHYVDTGAVRTYTWQLDETGTNRNIISITDRLCADCEEKTFIPPQASNSSTSASDQSQSEHDSQTANQADQAVIPDTDAAQPVLINSDGATDTFLMPSGEQIQISTNRSGDIINIANDKTDVRSALDRIARGNRQCTGGTEQECRTTIETLINQAHEVSLASKNTVDLTTRSGSNAPGCSLPAGRSCSELERDYEMAVLSTCVYHSGPCNSVWQPVNPVSIGLTQGQFEDGDGFYARLYQHPISGEYVLSFRGTLEMTDWMDNLHQFNGRVTDQYQRAYDLSIAVDQFLPTASNLSYTGHSLGGGLATVAALSTLDNATIFNSAALHPQTANQLAISYGNANQYVDNLTVDGEVVTWMQDYPPAEPSILSSFDEIQNHPEQVYYPAPGNRFLIPATSESLGPIDRHFMQAVTNSIRMILQNACGIYP